LQFNLAFVAGIVHFFMTVFAETGEPYYQIRQIPSGFFAAIDGIFAGTGKFLPRAPR